jgi:hypothetical protein
MSGDGDRSFAASGHNANYIQKSIGKKVLGWNAREIK